MAGSKRAKKSGQSAGRQERMTAGDVFGRVAEKGAQATGSPWAFALATLTLLVWLGSGPFFGFSNTWQLVINTTTTIVTFMMVFIIQSAENRDTQALQIKLDELLMALNREEMIDIEDLTATELKRLQSRMEERYGKLIPKDALE